MTSTCTCGDVKVTIKSKPTYIYDCNCSVCRKSGAAWGYFTSGEVKMIGDTVAFARNDKSEPKVEIHACPRCFATTHFVLHPDFKAAHPELDQTGVNMRLFNPDELVDVDVHYPNGKDWSGEGPFGFRREVLKITPEHPW